MTRSRACGVLVAIGWAAGALGPAAAPSRAAPLSACTSRRGTIVAVDFRHWGGPVLRGCGINAASGFALLHAAGFTSAGDEHDGPAFICRLGDGAFRGGMQYPTPREDPCIQTPPSSAYWSYWTAKPGQATWSLSQLGAMSDVPRPGEVELWTFGAGGPSGDQARPTITPASLRPPPGTPTIPATTATTTRTTRAVAPVIRTTSSASATSSGSVATGPSRPIRHRPRIRHRITSTATSVTATTSPPIPVLAATPTRARAAGGSPASLIAAAAIAALLCAGAGWATWRRRRPS